MAYKTIMAHVGIGQSNAELLRVVGDLAKQCDATLVGIGACQPMTMIYADAYVGGGAMVACQDELLSELHAAETEFRGTLKDSGVPLQWRSSYTADALSDYIAGEARCADLIVTSIVNAGPLDPSRHANVGDLVMRAGRPVLIVPRAGASAVFDRVVLAWKDTREARRAAREALPFLALAKHIAVVEIAEDGDLAEAQARVQDVVDWLSHHGIRAVPHAVPSRGDDASRLNAILAEQHADLVIAGAYGHSRLREWAFGGVTDDLLHGRHCALLSH